MIFDILTIFPDVAASVLSHGILAKAVKEDKIRVRVVNLRDYASDKHKVVDDRPFGGGEGMVMKPEPILRAIEAVKEKDPETKVVLLTPQGRLFTQEVGREMSKNTHLLFVCGRYEGVDERVSAYVDDELSIGDYVLSGGELAALVIIDCVARLLPDVLGSPDSAAKDSFSEGLLKHPQYTRPREWRGCEIPPVLLSGDHQKIAKWRRKESLKQTLVKRPDILQKVELSEEDYLLLNEIKMEQETKAVDGKPGPGRHSPGPLSGVQQRGCRNCVSNNQFGFA